MACTDDCFPLAKRKQIDFTLRHDDRGSPAERCFVGGQPVALFVRGRRLCTPSGWSSSGSQAPAARMTASNFCCLPSEVKTDKVPSLSLESETVPLWILASEAGYRLQQCIRQFPTVHTSAAAHVKCLFDVAERREDLISVPLRDSDVPDQRCSCSRRSSARSWTSWRYSTDCPRIRAPQRA